MTHRERVMAAIEHREPDRVPRDLGSVGNMICDETHLKVRKLLGLEGEPQVYRRGSTTSFYDEQMLDAFDIDFRHVWLDSPDKPKTILNEDGTTTDMWGVTWSASGSHPVIFPLMGKSEQDVANYKPPVLKKNWDITSMKERARYLHEETDYAVVAKSMMGPGGMFERCGYIRGIDDFFVDMMINKDVAHHLIDEITRVEIEMWDIFLDAVGPYIDIVQRVADVGTQTGLFISKELYREFIKPSEAKVYSHIKQRAPQVKLWFHSCGAVSELIDDFLDFGTDILNPVQPLATGMDSFELKKRYGDRLCFHGGIDLQKAMPGTIEDVKREVETRIRAFAPGGGYILAPANHIQDDTPPENVVFLYQYAKEFGTYPIK